MAAVVPVLLMLLLALTGCGGRDDEAAPPLCASANDYFWYAQDILGQSGSVPAGRRAERDVDGIRATLEFLADTVPPGLRDEVRFVRRLWADIDALASTYDYDTGSARVPERAYERVLARYEPDQDLGVRMAAYLQDQCRTGSTPFPTRPPAVSG